MSDIFYESAGQRHRLRLIERRGEKIGLFEDLDSPVPSRILCHIHAVDLLPRPHQTNIEVSNGQTI